MSMFTILLALFACASDTSSPEAFAVAYVDAVCAASAECGPDSSYDSCVTRIEDGWTEACQSEALPEWDEDRAAECLSSLQDACSTGEILTGCPGMCR